MTTDKALAMKISRRTMLTVVAAICCTPLPAATVERHRGLTASFEWVGNEHIVYLYGSKPDIAEFIEAFAELRRPDWRTHPDHTDALRVWLSSYVDANVGMPIVITDRASQAAYLHVSMKFNVQRRPD